MQAGIVLQIHDELVLESPPEETSQVRQILVDEMQSAMALDVPLIVSIHGAQTGMHATSNDTTSSDSNRLQKNS